MRATTALQVGGIAWVVVAVVALRWRLPADLPILGAMIFGVALLIVAALREKR